MDLFENPKAALLSAGLDPQQQSQSVPIAAPAAKELMTEVRNFPSHPPTNAELTAAKSASIQSLPGQFETTGATVGAISSIFLFDRPLDYYAKLPAEYNAVTSADVARVAQQDVHPGQLVIVAAGDRAKIEPGLKEAGLGPVEVRDINGTLITGSASATTGTPQK